jgi:hypothetical protein
LLLVSIFVVLLRFILVLDLDLLFHFAVHAIADPFVFSLSILFHNAILNFLRRHFLSISLIICSLAVTFNVHRIFPHHLLSRM